MLQGPCDRINTILFEEIDEALVLKAALETKGGSGPLGLDADGWRRILAPKMFGDCGKDLREAIAKCHQKYLKYGERKRRFIGGVSCMSTGISGQTTWCPAHWCMGGDLENMWQVQMCSGQKTGGEAAIHTMRRVFGSEE